MKKIFGNFNHKHIFGFIEHSVVLNLQNVFVFATTLSRIGNITELKFKICFAYNLLLSQNFPVFCVIAKNLRIFVNLFFLSMVYLKITLQ